MRLFEFEYKTKSGKDITFTVSEDDEGDDNRGWIAHRIDAFIDGKPAGYIRTTYVDSERFKEWYPSLLHFMAHIQGKGLPGGTSNKAKTPLEEMDDATLNQIMRELYKEGYSWTRNNFKEVYGDYKEMDRPTLLKTLKTILAKDPEFKDKRKAFNDFKKYFVDKPIVDYIKVYDSERFMGRSDHPDKGETDFRGQGISTSLYRKMAEFLKSKGLRLYASKMQSPEAKLAWKGLERRGWVKTEGGRRYLDPSVITELRGDSEAIDIIKQTSHIIPEDNYDLMRVMLKRGWKKLGGGSYGLVFSHKDYPYVLKFYTEKDVCYDLFVRLCQKINNPHFPKFKGKPIKIGKYKAVRIENLTRLPYAEYVDNLPLLAAKLRILDYINPARSIFTAVKNDLGIDDMEEQSKKIDELYDQFKKEQPEFAKALMILKKVLPNNCDIDLHDGNFMKRGKTWVIIDPAAPLDDEIFS